MFILIDTILWDYTLFELVEILFFSFAFLYVLIGFVVWNMLRFT